MLNNNSDKIRNIKGKPFMLQAGGKKGRPTLLHNGINGQKGGTNSKGTPPKPGKVKKVDHLGMAIGALKKKKK